MLEKQHYDFVASYYDAFKPFENSTRFAPVHYDRSKSVLSRSGTGENRNGQSTAVYSAR
jgi:hypothetical protein